MNGLTVTYSHSPAPVFLMNLFARACIVLAFNFRLFPSLFFFFIFLFRSKPSFDTIQRHTMVTKQSTQPQPGHQQQSVSQSVSQRRNANKTKILPSEVRVWCLNYSQSNHWSECGTNYMIRAKQTISKCQISTWKLSFISNTTSCTLLAAILHKLATTTKKKQTEKQ